MARPVAMALDRIAELSDADRGELRALSVAVYPPEESATWSGGKLEWSAAEWCVRVRGEDGALASYVGISLRDAQHDGQPVRVGGIGGVKTHPAARGRGLVGGASRRHDRPLGATVVRRGTCQSNTIKL
jgi:hypothetical protein